jgi:hypothetical protein
MHKGRHGNYYWLVSADGNLCDLVLAMPQLVVGKRVVVTAFDSGPLQLTSGELQAGWQQVGPIAVSPRIADASALPCDNYDEWYAFEDGVPDFEATEPFVSCLGFSAVPPAESGWDETWDHVARQQLEALQDRFWVTLERLNPAAYFACGELLTLVTKSEPARDRAWEYFATAK